MSYCDKRGLQTKKWTHIHVALASDQNYLPGLLVASCSLALYAHAETVIEFHILDGGIDDSGFCEYERALKRIHSNAAIHRYQVSGENFAKCTLYNNSLAPYARLLLPSLLTAVERVLYIDCDILWMRPVEELWGESFDGKWAMACYDDAFPESIKTEIDYLTDVGFRVNVERYFNSGIIMMDLKAMRDNGVVDSCFDFLRKCKVPRFPDQSVLNAVLADHVKLIDHKWNALFPQTCESDFVDGVVLHYINATPWLNRSARVTHDNRIYLWHAFRGMVVKETTRSSIRKFFSFPVAFKKRLNALLLTNRVTGSLAYRIFNVVARKTLPKKMVENVRSLSAAQRREIEGAWRDMFRARGIAE